MARTMLGLSRGDITREGELATVLVAWELGGGMGHVARLLPVARELAAQGHRAIFVVKNLVEPAPLLANSLHSREDTHPLRQVVSRCAELL